MTNILITGATGFIAQYIVKELAMYPELNLTVASRNIVKLQSIFDKHIKTVVIDINKPKKSWFKKCNQPDAIIHLAWGELNNFKSAIHITQELPNHLHFLNTMIQDGVKHILVSGTCLEYGLTNGKLTENIHTNPTTAYGIAKDSLRKCLQIICAEQQCQLTWLRYFYIYGKGQSPKTLLAQLETSIKNKSPEFKMSKGEQLRDYLPVETVAKYTAKIFKAQIDGIINVCSGSAISINQLVENKKLELNSNIKLNKGFYKYPDYEPMAFWGDTTKLNKIINKA